MNDSPEMFLVLVLLILVGVVIGPGYHWWSRGRYCIVIVWAAANAEWKIWTLAEFRRMKNIFEMVRSPRQLECVQSGFFTRARAERRMNELLQKLKSSPAAKD